MVGTPDLKSGYPEFNASTGHEQDLFQWPVSQKFQNFLGPFRVLQYPLYIRKAEFLGVKQSSWFFFIKNMLKDKLGIWARKVLGAFEKQASCKTSLLVKSPIWER